MKIAISYPNDKVLKMKTLRYLEKSGISKTKVTWIADTLPLEEEGVEFDKNKFLNTLKDLGNEILELNDNNDTKGKRTEENNITFRLEDFTIEQLDEIAKEKAYVNRSALINKAIKQLVEGKEDENLKENLKFFYDIFVKNASKFVMNINEIEKVELIEGVLD